MGNEIGASIFVLMKKVQTPNGEKTFCYVLQGQVTNLKGEPLEDVKIVLNSHPVHVIHPAKFLAVLPIGSHRMTFSVQNYESKTVNVEVKAGEMTRKNVVLESSIGVELKYHVDRNIGMFMQQLVNAYPGKAR